MRNSIILTAAAVLGVGILGFSGSVLSADPAETAPPAAATEPATLQVTDCVKCHPAFVQQVDEAGNRHKSEVTCLDCHEGTHPPGVEKGSLIPQCTKCHSDNPHFQLENCLSCHQNPHQPLKIVFSGDVKTACNTCHSEVVAEIDSNQSKHSQVDCSFCHDKHGYKPDCLNCHAVHVDGQKFEDCVTCHQVHNPRKLAYGTEVPNSACGGCHGDIRTTLESGSTKHAAFQCVFCHADKHGNVPQCRSCHEAPHNEEMMSKFKSCIDCHQSAHNLLK